MDKKEIIRPSKMKTEDTMKMKLDIPQSDNMNFQNEQEHEQDRISEKLSYSVPMAPLRPGPDPALSGYIGKFVRLQLRDGRVIIGDLVQPQWDLLRLENVEEIGKGYKLTAAWCAIRDDSVAGIYPGNATVEEISKP
jgi:hypothetical protein